MDLNTLAENYGVPNPTGLPSIPMPPMPGMEGAAPQPQGPSAPTPPEAPQQAPQSLDALYAKWTPQASTYAAELRAAQERERAEQAAFNQLIESSVGEKSAKPSQAEMFFRLAAAFGAPTRTGHFTESLGNAGKAMADYEQENRQIAGADRKQALDARLKLRSLGLQSAKDETASLRALAGQDMQAQRALMLQDAQSKRQIQAQEAQLSRQEKLEMLKAELASGKPQSEAGKLAMDAGYQPGTPKYNEFVTKYVADKFSSGDIYKQMAAGNAAIMASIAQQNADTNRARLEDKREADKRKASTLTPQEMKLKTETEDIIATGESAVADLERALKLNKTAFGTSVGDTIQRKALGAFVPGDPRVRDTEDFENALGTQAISKLKETFPGAISNDERKALTDLQGLGAKSKEARERIIQRSMEVLRTGAARRKARLADIKAGKYRQTEDAKEEE